MLRKIAYALAQRSKEYAKVNIPIFWDYYMTGISFFSMTGLIVATTNMIIDDDIDKKRYYETWRYYLLIGILLPIVIPIQTYKVIQRIKE